MMIMVFIGLSPSLRLPSPPLSRKISLSHVSIFLGDDIIADIHSHYGMAIC